MSYLTKPEYQDVREWIKRQRIDKKIEWNILRLGKRTDEHGLELFLNEQRDNNDWPNLTLKEWYEIVESQEKEESEHIDFSNGISMITDEHQENEVSIPTDRDSCWQLYKSKLKKNGFNNLAIDEIEKATIKILKKLSSDTTQNKEPIKGLVIGNVQSGKTANMAALMAMAADWGWNFFVILSGTIDNLRKQTQERLFNDLNSRGNLVWRVLEHLSTNVDISQKPESLHFGEGDIERYFTVCLKNSTRLRNLIKWAQYDRNVQKQMKILVIDDEADQAGINTSKIDPNSNEVKERKQINKLLCNFVNGKKYNGEESQEKYKAMNYIGYTATPYANILNEAGRESLYPRNFIVTLAVSKEYFGPQQIFGYKGKNIVSNDENIDGFDGLNIVREISSSELKTINDIHDGATIIPISLQNAIMWFLCCVSCMRYWQYKKPISMLVHTSQKTIHHEKVAKIIENYLKNLQIDEILSQAKKLWEKETKIFSLDKFIESYPTYLTKEEIKNYPSFDELEEEITSILKTNVSNIPLDLDNENSTLSYHNGIHLCIDNCQNNGTDNGMYIRLAYPNSKNMPSPAPAFIVVGGATLSRGLTIEGLVSTFFIRSVGQADTLMQMGRWFGYRKGYELLPRIWLTKKAKKQFEFLAELDQELRDTIHYMDINGQSPSMYGPKVKNSPKVSLIKLTAKNKMQSAKPTDLDYTGASNQTYLFDDNEEILNQNIQLTEEFLSKLGSSSSLDEHNILSKNCIIWRDIPFQTIRAFLENFKFQERLKVFNNLKPLLDWVEKVSKDKTLLGNWNVVVAGRDKEAIFKHDNGVWNLPHNLGKINKVIRTRKTSNDITTNSIINIGVLRDPKDLLSDIDFDKISDSKVKETIDNFIKNRKFKDAPAYRDKAGLNTVPQLLIYRIAKDSEPTKISTSRQKLSAPSDLIGLCIYIPGGKPNGSYAKGVQIKFDNIIGTDESELESQDEN